MTISEEYAEIANRLIDTLEEFQYIKDSNVTIVL